MPNTGLTFWCGLSFRIIKVELICYKNDKVSHTCLPSSDGNLEYTVARHDTGAYDHVCENINDSKITRDSLLNEIRKHLPWVRITLSCDDLDKDGNEGTNRNVVVRWNRSRQGWSAFQTGWEGERLLVIKHKAISKLLTSGDPWVFPTDEKDRQYHEAIRRPINIKDLDMFYTVAAVIDHKEVKNSTKYQLRWEDLEDSYTWYDEGIITLFAKEQLLEYKARYRIE